MTVPSDPHQDSHQDPHQDPTRDMSQDPPPDPPPVPTMDLARRKALLFALTAERLAVFYEHGQWLTVAQGASLAADWLHRARLPLDLKQRRAISDVSDTFARELATTLSEQAGLFTAHEMMEGLDARYQSAVTLDLLEECERRLRAEGLDGAA